MPRIDLKRNGGKMRLHCTINCLVIFPLRVHVHFLGTLFSLQKGRFWNSYFLWQILPYFCQVTIFTFLVRDQKVWCCLHVHCHIAQAHVHCHIAQTWKSAKATDNICLDCLGHICIQVQQWECTTWRATLICVQQCEPSCHWLTYNAVNLVSVINLHRRHNIH